MKAALTVNYRVRGDAVSSRDYAPLSGSVTIPAGQASALITLTPSPDSQDDKTVVVALAEGSDFHIGCPSASLVVIRH